MSCEHKIAQSPCLPHTGNTTQNMAGRLVVGAFRHSSPALLARGLRVAVQRAPCIDHSFASGRLFSRAYSSDVKPPPGDLCACLVCCSLIARMPVLVCMKGGVRCMRDQVHYRDQHFVHNIIMPPYLAQTDLINPTLN